GKPVAQHKNSDDIQVIYRGGPAYAHVSRGSTGALRGMGYSGRSKGSLRYAKTCRYTTLPTRETAVLKVASSTSMYKRTIPQQGAIEDFMNAIELESSFHPTRRTLVHLERPLLVGLNLQRNGEMIKVYCESRDIGYDTLRITTPCKLGIKPGMQMELDLYLGDSADSIRIDARVLRIDPSHAEDIVRFVVELEYTALSSVAQAQICHLIQESSLEPSLHLLT
ncbi:MAG: hypothetical protein ACPL7O_12815, partial [Armatimonadota bacterium]